MLLADGFGPVVLHAELDQAEHGEHAGLDAAAHPDDGAAEVRHTELAERILVGGIGLHHVGQVVSELLHGDAVVVDRQDLVA